MSQLKGRKWHVQAAVATRGEGLYEGLDWCGHPACSTILPGQGGCRSKGRCVPCWVATRSLRVLICCRTVGACRIFFSMSFLCVVHVCVLKSASLAGWPALLRACSVRGR